KRTKSVKVRPCNPRMQDVADDRDDELAPVAAAPAGGGFLSLADRKEVKKCLRRMLVAAVARIDDRAIDDAGKETRRARSRMAHDDAVGRHRSEVSRGVLERLAFGHARRGCRDV